MNWGVITDVKSLYEYSFQEFEKGRDKNKNASVREKSQHIMACPPLLEGDFWIEEASRVYSGSVARYFRTKKSPTSKACQSFVPKKQFLGNDSKCPAMHVAAVLQDDIMVHPSAAPFCRPVNAAALKLHDYHNIIQKPMNLGSVVTRCLLGEYDTFGEIVSDIELVFKNAMRYNPKGHIVHTLASDLLQYSMTQLLSLVNYWKSLGVTHLSPCKESDGGIFEAFADLSMKLGVFISVHEEEPMKNELSSNSSTNIRKIERVEVSVETRREPHLSAAATAQNQTSTSLYANGVHPVINI